MMHQGKVSFCDALNQHFGCFLYAVALPDVTAATPRVRPLCVDVLNNDDVSRLSTSPLYRRE
jgi:hypothetical protein